MHWIFAYPVTSGLSNIFSDLLWWKTERTNLWCKCWRSTNFTTGGTEVAINCSQPLCSLSSIPPIIAVFRFRQVEFVLALVDVLQEMYLHHLDFIWVDLWSCANSVSTMMRFKDSTLRYVRILTDFCRRLVFLQWCQRNLSWCLVRNQQLILASQELVLSLSR